MMKLFLAVIVAAMALLLGPVVDQAIEGLPLRPNVALAALPIVLSLCSGGPAVACCGLYGLVLDCLAGPQLGARAACFGLVAALASIVADRHQSAARRVIGCWTLLFVAQMLSRMISLSEAGRGLRFNAFTETALSATATSAFVSGLWLASHLIAATVSRRAPHGFSVAIGRAAGEG
jgi:cell shape-determining protein MreD